MFPMFPAKNNSYTREGIYISLTRVNSYISLYRIIKIAGNNREQGTNHNGKSSKFIVICGAVVCFLMQTQFVTDPAILVFFVRLS